MTTSSLSLAIAITLAACSSPTPPLADASTGPSDAGPSDAPPDAGDVAPPPFTQGTSTLAGRANAGYVDGSRDMARFSNPVNVAVRDGRVYVADFDNNKVRVIELATRQTSTLIAQPGFRRPFGLAFASDGTLYVSTDDDQNGGHSLMSGSIWKVAPGTQTAVLVAGAIGRPRGIAVLPDGRIAATDYAHHVIELIEPSTGAVTVLAGVWDQAGFVDDTGAAARFSTPYGIAVRGDGALVIADFNNHRIRLVTLAGVATTLAGAGASGFQDGGLGAAMFDLPQAVAIDDSGDIFVTEVGNNRIRRITGSTVQAVAGTGIAGYLDHDDPLASVFYGLEGVAVLGDGSMLFVADGGRGETLPFNRIRQVAKHW